MIYKKSLFGAAVLGFIAGSNSASAIDTQEAFQCAIMETVACGLRMGCETGGADLVNLPDFIQVDIPEGQVTGNRPDGTDLTTKIERTENLRGSTIIQGGEYGLGWTILINAETGHITVSGTRDDIGFLIFGACNQN